MKYILTLLTLLAIGCSGSKNPTTSDRQAQKNTPFYFFDGARNRSVDQDGVSQILYRESSGGTIVMKDGRQYSFESLGYQIRTPRSEVEQTRQQYMHQIEAYARQRNPEYTSGLQPN